MKTQLVLVGTSSKDSLLEKQGWRTMSDPSILRLGHLETSDIFTIEGKEVQAQLPHHPAMPWVTPQSHRAEQQAVHSVDGLGAVSWAT